LIEISVIKEDGMKRMGKRRLLGLCVKLRGKKTAGYDPAQALKPTQHQLATPRDTDTNTTVRYKRRSKEL
jgi:hypothetical protein